MGLPLLCRFRTQRCPTSVRNAHQSGRPPTTLNFAPPYIIGPRAASISIHTGGDGSSAQWRVDRRKAVPVTRAARRFAGAKADLSTATAAVRRSAVNDHASSNATATTSSATKISA